MEIVFHVPCFMTKDLVALEQREGNLLSAGFSIFAYWEVTDFLLAVACDDCPAGQQFQPRELIGP